MKHNFPKNVSIGCTLVHNLKQGKEILHLAIDGGCEIYSKTITEIIDKKYPRFCWDDSRQELCLTSDLINDKNYIWVSFEQFKAFLQGKGKYTVPFKQELQLNSQYKAIVTKNDIKVGCQSFTHDVVKKLYQLSLKAQKS